MTDINDLRKSLENIDTLPAMPAIAQKLLALPLDTDEGEAQLLKLIAQDPQISAKIVGLSNTALFGAPRNVTSVTDAAMCLGLARVKSVAIGIATMSALATQHEGKFKFADLWTHNMAIAVAMRIIARHMPTRLRPMDDHIFLAGLLHDIGYSALSYLDTAASNALYEKLNVMDDTPQLVLENDMLGIHHGEIGARLALHWGLPDEIVTVIRYHHAPDDANADEARSLVRLVSIAEKILPGFGITEHIGQEITQQEWLDLGIDPGEVDAILEEVKVAAEQTRQLNIS